MAKYLLLVSIVFFISNLHLRLSYLTNAFSFLAFLIILFVQAKSLSSTTPFVKYSKSSQEFRLLESVNRLKDNTIINSDLESQELTFLSLNSSKNFLFTANTAGYPISNLELAKRIYLSLDCRSFDKNFVLANEEQILAYSRTAPFYKESAWKNYLDSLRIPNSLHPLLDEEVLQQFLALSENLRYESCARLLSKFSVNYILTRNPSMRTSLINKNLCIRVSQIEKDIFTIEITGNLTKFGSN